jgi:uncharacterized protein (TIGR02246 family)
VNYSNNKDQLMISKIHYLASCALAALVLSGTASADSTRNAIEAVNAQFVAAFGQGDSKAVASLYTVNAQLMPDGSDAIKGRAAIQKSMQGVIDSGVASFSLTTLEKFGSGSTATEVGVYEMRDKAGKAVDHGKYMVLWRQVNGIWQLHRDIFNSSLPPSK